VEYKSSVTEMDHFVGSHVYDDMMLDFEDWLDGARDKMENTDDVNEVYRCQGRIQVMRSVLQWAENFRDTLEEKQDDN
jgi:hypothetical protein